jgi:hypothetical protein
MSEGLVRYRVEWGTALGLFACLAALPSLAHARTINVELAADATIWIAEVADPGGAQFVVTADASGGSPTFADAATTGPMLAASVEPIHWR